MHDDEEVVHDVHRMNKHKIYFLLVDQTSTRDSAISRSRHVPFFWLDISRMLIFLLEIKLQNNVSHLSFIWYQENKEFYYTFALKAIVNTIMIQYERYTVILYFFLSFSLFILVDFSLFFFCKQSNIAQYFKIDSYYSDLFKCMYCVQLLFLMHIIIFYLLIIK